MVATAREANILSLIAARSNDTFEVFETRSFIRIFNHTTNVLRFPSPAESDEALAEFAVTMKGI